MAATIKVPMAGGADQDSSTLQYYAQVIKDTVTDTVTAALDSGLFQANLVSVYVAQDAASSNGTNSTNATYSFVVTATVTTSAVSVVIEPTATPTAAPSATPTTGPSADYYGGDIQNDVSFFCELDDLTQLYIISIQLCL